MGVIEMLGICCRRLSKPALTALVLAWPALAAAQPPDPTNSDANHNTAAGTSALLNITALNNTAIGDSALKSSTSAYGNTASGSFALHANTTGSYNSATGSFALYSNTTGPTNTATGASSLYFNTTGGYNTGNGYAALYYNTTGVNNTAAGYEALLSNTTGNNNTGLGFGTLYQNLTGSNNIAAGYEALFSNTAGSNNLAEGYNALYASTGSNNVALGYGALRLLTSGDSNIALGLNAGKNTKTGTGNIFIGNNGAANESHVTRIGVAQTKAFVAGISGVHVNGASVVINAQGQLGVITSSARYKQDIHALDGTSGKLAQLRPVSYQYRTEPGVTHFGLIAEEVDKVLPELVVRDEKNEPDSVQYQEIIPLLLEEQKEQRAEIENERKIIAALRTINERQQATIAEQSARLSAVERRLSALHAN